MVEFLKNHKNLKVYIKKATKFLKKRNCGSEAVLNIRKALEYIIKQYCEKNGIAITDEAGHSVELADLINSLGRINCFSAAQVDVLHKIRKLGNQGAHDIISDDKAKEAYSQFEPFLLKFLNEFPYPYINVKKDENADKINKNKKYFYYSLLGVRLNASQDEISKAYRSMAKKYHPDSPSGDAAMFVLFNEAYQTLRDPEKRQRYDWEQSHSEKEKQSTTYDSTQESKKERKRTNVWSSYSSLYEHYPERMVVCGILAFLAYYWFVGPEDGLIALSLAAVIGFNIGVSGLGAVGTFLIGILVLILLTEFFDFQYKGIVLAILLSFTPFASSIRILIDAIRERVHRITAMIQIIFIIPIFAVCAIFFYTCYIEDLNEIEKDAVQASIDEAHDLYTTDATIRNVPDGVDFSKSVVTEGLAGSMDELISFTLTERVIVDHQQISIDVPIYMELFRIYKNEEWDEIQEVYTPSNMRTDYEYYDYYYIQFIVEKDPSFVEEYSLDPLVGELPEFDCGTTNADYVNGYYSDDGTRLDMAMDVERYEGANDGLIIIRIPKDFHEYGFTVGYVWQTQIGWNLNELLQ